MVLATTALSNPAVASVDPGDDLDLHEVQKVAMTVIDRAAPAVVRISGGGRVGTAASGVIFDPSGLVLTAGHVARDLPERLRIELPDGTRRIGRVVGEFFEGDVDLGLIEILRNDEDGIRPWPTVPLAAVDSIDPGEWVVGLGHAASITGIDIAPPAARLGRVLAVQGAELAIDSPIDAGDSGGPILDLEGHVIGIASRCGHLAWQNLATSIDAIHAWMPRLMDPGNPAPDVEAWDGRTRHRSSIGTRRDPNLLTSIEEATRSIRGRLVGIRDRDRLVGSGTIVGPGRVVAKASQIGRHVRSITVAPSASTEPASLTARPIGVVSELDLVLLEVPGLACPPIPDGIRRRPLDAGSIVVVPALGGGVAGIGAVARERDELASRENPDDRPFLGVGTSASGDGGLRVRQVVPNSTAGRADLRTGDVIRTLDGIPVRRSRELFDLLGDRRIGDSLILAYDRDHERRELELTLGIRPETGRIGVPSNTSLGTSRISSGFGPVHLVDADLPLTAVGSPIADLHGRLAGWIVAKRSRTSMVVLPWSRVAAAVAEIPPSRPEAVSRRLEAYRVTATPDRGGLLRLDAEDAYPDGAELRRERLGPEGRTTWTNWSNVDDALVWNARFDSPGRWLVQLRSACPPGHAGTPIRIGIGDRHVDGRIEPTAAWDDFGRTDVGVLEVTTEGPVSIRLESRARPRRNVANILGLELRRLRDRNEDEPARESQRRGPR